MTIGIYRLCFSGTNSCYIGQSINIEKRYEHHLSSFITGKANSKMMEAYNRYGVPSLEILCECAVEELNTAENEAIELFDSVNNGFNVLKHAGDIPKSYGEHHPKSKYTNNQVLQVAKLLTNPSNSYPSISKITGMSVDNIQNIALLKVHSWLSEADPVIYHSLLRLQKVRSCTAEFKGIKYLPVISPDGVVYENITNHNAFCREHGLQQGNFNQVLNGKRKTHKGWRLAENV